MAQGKPAGLGPDSQAVRLAPHLDFVHRARVGVEAVGHVVITPAQPEVFAVAADVAHVGAATARNGPIFGHGTAGKVNHRDAAFAARSTANFVAAAVGHVQAFAVAAAVK